MNSNFIKLIHGLILNWTALVKIPTNLSSQKEYPGYDYQPSTFILKLNVKLLKLYSETCLSWPPTIPETVINLHKCVPK